MARGDNNGERPWTPPSVVDFKQTGNIASKTSPRFLSETEYFKLIKPRDWLVRNMIERGFLYTLTAQWGGGKTAIAQLIAFLMGTADEKIDASLGPDHAIKKGRATMLSGENPDEAFRRAYALKKTYGAKSETRVTICPDLLPLDQYRQWIEEDCKKRGNLDFIIVDTYQAFFAMSGADISENDNAEVMKFATVSRGLCTVPGNPAVIILCHPVKNVTDHKLMIPRGGGALMGATDGNLTLVTQDKRMVEMHHSDKLRGPGFEPLLFEIPIVYPDGLVEVDGTPSSSVVARLAGSDVVAKQAAQGRDTSLKILEALDFDKKGLRVEKLCEQTGRAKTAVYKELNGLKEAHLVEHDPLEKGVYLITDKGHKRRVSAEQRGMARNGAESGAK